MSYFRKSKYGIGQGVVRRPSSDCRLKQNKNKSTCRNRRYSRKSSSRYGIGQGKVLHPSTDHRLKRNRSKSRRSTSSSRYSRRTKYGAKGAVMHPGSDCRLRRNKSKSQCSKSRSSSRRRSSSQRRSNQRRSMASRYSAYSRKPSRYSAYSTHMQKPMSAYQKYARRMHSRYGVGQGRVTHPSTDHRLRQNESAAQHMAHVRAGHKGGLSLKREKGPGYFSRLGHKGGLARWHKSSRARSSTRSTRGRKSSRSRSSSRSSSSGW